MTKQHVTDALRRMLLFVEQDGRCFYCTEPMETPPYLGPVPPSAVTLEHLEPRSHGGKRRYPNEVAACRACNQARGIMPWLLFFCLKELEREAKLRRQAAPLLSVVAESQP